MPIPSLRWRFRSIGFVVVTLLTASMVASAQFDDDTGPVGRVDDGDSSPPPGPTSGLFPGDEDTQEYPGPIGRVAERLLHPECDTCFTVSGLGEERYQIFEQLDMGGEEFLVPRMVPNPAPLRGNEIRERYDEETGEDIWYIGHQAFIGPTDDEQWTDALPYSRIELQRIQMDYQEEIMGIVGVHRFGLSPDGFSVGLDPVHTENLSQIPTFIEDIPVEVEIEAMLQGSSTLGHTRFRPVPIGAPIAGKVTNLPAGQFIVGTLGPHVVRDAGSCCQIWSLTAGHVVKRDPDDPNPTPGTRAVYQPFTGQNTPSSNLLGYVAHTFRLQPCSNADLQTLQEWEEACSQSGVPLNATTSEPDIAAIDHTPFGDYHAYPFDRPEGTDPTRKMVYRADRYVDGPSGRIVTAYPGHKHKLWGAQTPAADRGRVKAAGQVAYVEMGFDHKVYKVCCINSLNLPSRAGDSGALVAYSGTGRRHVAGVTFATSSTTGYAWYIPANDIKMAFSNAQKAFHHYWGTKSGYWQPSGRSTDLD